MRLYNSYDNHQHINSTTRGTLTKSYRDSFFVRFAKGSEMEDFYFREDKPSRIVDRSNYSCDAGSLDWEKKGNTYYKLKEIVVLQVVLCDDNNYLIEAIDKDNYDKMFGIIISDDEDDR